MDALPIFFAGVVGLMLIQWDGQVWALATPLRRRITVALLVAAALGGTTTYAISYGFPNCYPSWVCAIFWICGC